MSLVSFMSESMSAEQSSLMFNPLANIGNIDSESPMTIFNQGISGAWFDPSDMSTMFQDAAGTTPVTAVEQPVGLMLDKSHGLMLGPELVSNGDFSNGSTGWGLGAGWIVSDEKIIGTNTTVNFNQALPVTGMIGMIGSAYIVEFDVVITGGTIRAEIGLGFGVTLAATGHYKSMIITKTTGLNLYIYGQSAFTGTIDNISVREFKGNYATQSITASRPTLSARKNLLLATETLATQSVASIAASYVLSFYGTGSVTLSGTATGILTGTGVNDRVSLTVTPTAGTLTLTVSGSVTKAQLELGASAGPYQRVNTETDYDTDERYFPKYLRFDGVDDYMVYNSPYASSNNPSTHIIGVASRSFSVNLGFLTINPTSTTPSTQRSISMDSASTVKADCRDYPYAKSGTVDIANIHVFSASFGGTKGAAISVDGGAYTTAIYGTPNTTSTDTAIGKGITNVITAFNFYGIISVGADLTEHQRHLCERYLVRKSGVQL